MATVTVAREALLQAVDAARSATAARTTKPHYQCVKLSPEPGGLTVAATDGEVAVARSVMADGVPGGWAACLPAGRFAELLKAADGPDVTLTVGADRCGVRTRTGKFDLPTPDPAAFPDPPAWEDAAPATAFTAAGFRRLIRLTGFALGEDGKSYVFSSFLFECGGGVLRLAATDGKRLAVAECEAAGPDQSGLLPKKAADVVERQLTDNGETLRVVIREGAALFRTERATVHTPLVVGRFPPWRSFMPKSAAVRIDLPVAQFLSAVRQAAVLSDAVASRLSFAFGPGAVTVSSAAGELGAGEVTCDLPGFAGPPLAIDLDPRLVTDVLRATGEGATFEGTRPDKPVVFRAGPTYFCLVTPMVQPD